MLEQPVLGGRVRAKEKGESSCVECDRNPCGGTEQVATLLPTAMHCSSCGKQIYDALYGASDGSQYCLKCAEELPLQSATTRPEEPARGRLRFARCSEPRFCGAIMAARRSPRLCGPCDETTGVDPPGTVTPSELLSIPVYRRHLVNVSKGFRLARPPVTPVTVAARKRFAIGWSHRLRQLPETLC